MIPAGRRTSTRAWTPLGRARAAIDANDGDGLRESLDPERLSRAQQAELLHAAAEAGRLEAVRILVEAGVPPWLQNRDGFFAHQIAAEAGRDDVAAFLGDAMEAFRATAAERTAAARPLFDRLSAALEAIDGGAAPAVALTGLAGHPFLDRYDELQLRQHARTAVGRKGAKPVASVSDTLAVTFRRSNRFAGYFEAVIETDGEALRITTLGGMAGSIPRQKL